MGHIYSSVTNATANLQLSFKHLYNGLMVAFGHTAVGTLVGVVSYKILGQGDIALGLIITGFIGWVSHYLTDLIPHGHFFREGFEQKIIWVIIFDLLIPVLFILGLAHYFAKSYIEILYLLFGIGGAQLPDVLSGLRNIRVLPKINILNKEYNFHMSTHWHGQEENALLFTIKDIWQVLLFILAVLVLVSL